FTWCAKAYALRPDDAQLEKELERLAQEAEAWDELVDIYLAQVGQEKDPERQVVRYRQLGRIALNRLHRPADARSYFEEVLTRPRRRPRAGRRAGAPAGARRERRLRHAGRAAGAAGRAVPDPPQQARRGAGALPRRLRAAAGASRGTGGARALARSRRRRAD